MASTYNLPKISLWRARVLSVARTQTDGQRDVWDVFTVLASLRCGAASWPAERCPRLASVQTCR